MENSKADTKPNITAIIAMLLFIGILIYLTIVLGRNERVKDDLREEKLQSELLLSEKLLEQKKNVQLLADNKERERITKKLNEELQAVRALVSQKDLELKKVKSGVKDRVISKQQGEIKLLREKIVRDSIKNEDSLTKFKKYAGHLESLVLEKKNETEGYLDEIERLKRLQIYNTQVESIRKNQKLTFKASKTKVLRAVFEVSALTQNLSFKIFNPDNKELPANNTNTIIKSTDIANGSSAMASMVSPDIQLNSIEARRKVEVIYTAKEKLTPGIYTIALLSNEELIDHIYLRLE